MSDERDDAAERVEAANEALARHARGLAQQGLTMLVQQCEPDPRLQAEFYVAAALSNGIPEDLRRLGPDPVSALNRPRGYAGDQSGIPPVEHDHDAEQKRLSNAVVAAVWRFAEAIEDVSATGIEGLEVVLPSHLYQAVAKDLLPARSGDEYLTIGMAGGIVKLRSAKE